MQNKENSKGRQILHTWIMDLRLLFY